MLLPIAIDFCYCLLLLLIALSPCAHKGILLRRAHPRSEVVITMFLKDIAFLEWEQWIIKSKVGGRRRHPPPFILRCISPPLGRQYVRKIFLSNIFHANSGEILAPALDNIAIPVSTRGSPAGCTSQVPGTAPGRGCRPGIGTTQV